MNPEIVVRKAQITLDWADGRHTFRLPVAQLEELQELCDAGPALIAARLAAQPGQWRYRDIAATIRLGLIGGGMKAADALKLVRRYVEPPVPLMENLPVAQAILSVVLVGVPDEAPKEQGEGISDRSRPSQTESSASPSSMDAAAQWESTSVN